MRRAFTKQGLGYVLTVPELAVEISVDRLSRTRGEMHGELAVSCGLPGTRSADGRLHNARFNISGGTTRGSLAKTLAKREGSTRRAAAWIPREDARQARQPERHRLPVDVVLVGALGERLREGSTRRHDAWIPRAWRASSRGIHASCRR